MAEQNKKPNDVPYIVYEGAEARAERHIKRLIVALVLTVLMLFASNAFWLCEWTQYDYSSTETSTEVEYKQDGQGTNIIAGKEVLYGADANH